MRPEVTETLSRLEWMRRERIWPNGPRYLWTDAFGVVLLVSLASEVRDDQYLDAAERVVAEVGRVLGRPRGIRIGEAPDRDGQYFHYLAMWLFALHVLAEKRPTYRPQAIALVREIHPPFVRPGVGVIWKMREDLSAPYPGFGYGALDPFHGYVIYRLLGEVELAGEIRDMQGLVQRLYVDLDVTQDLGLGMILWMSHFFPGATWARVLRERSLATLDRMWVDPPGYFCREPDLRDVRFAFTNHGVSVGLQAVGAHPERIRALQRYFATYRSNDEYDRDAITHVMACSSLFPGKLIQRCSQSR
jgi:hypothetical protein